MYVRAQTTKLAKASTIACLSSAMLEQLDALDTSNMSSRVDTWRDEPSGIRALNTTQCHSRQWCTYRCSVRVLLSLSHTET